jgi:hypothetical protein
MTIEAPHSGVIQQQKDDPGGEVSVILTYPHEDGGFGRTILRPDSLSFLAPFDRERLDRILDNLARHQAKSAGNVTEEELTRLRTGLRERLQSGERIEAPADIIRPPKPARSL